MFLSRFAIHTLDERSDLLDSMQEVIAEAWPEFMLHDSVADRYWDDLYDVFPCYQFALVEEEQDEVVAVGNSIPLHWEGDIEELPDEGFGWALEAGFDHHAAGHAPNMLAALSISIAPTYRSRGISIQMVEAMKNIGGAQGLSSLAAPVRPSKKNLYPLTPMERYITWQNDSGLPFDPWLRVHARLGGSLVRICPRSMQISGTPQEWEEWTDMKFPESGTYLIPGALNPMEMDLQAGRGVYIEPNVWMVHGLE